jgi:glycosyltransferase involved in cell wall biosynthesis
MKLPLSVIILTYNEEIHLERLLKNIADWADEILIVDSYSTDRTVEIVKSFGANVYQNKWINYATQFNWALQNLDIKNEWVVRLDADEYLTEELKKEISERLPAAPPETTGFYIKRRVYFMGRWIKYGGYYPIWLLRIWRKGKAKIEERFMDEHVVLSEGRAEKLNNDFIDNNMKDLTWWIDKHNGYAIREAMDMVAIERGLIKGDNINASILGTQEQKKRWIKQNLYSRMPLFIRPFLYFFYRYFIRLGFLDGKEGLIFHFLQGFWYRFLVDAKLYEMKKVDIEKLGKI